MKVVKVASSSRAAGHGHGHGHKGGGFIPPHNNPPPKGVAPSTSGRIGHSTLQNDVGSSDQDDCALSVQASNVFLLLMMLNSLSK